MGKKLFNDKQSGLHVAVDNLPELKANVGLLTVFECLVGVPSENSDRDDPWSKDSGITNAAIAFVQDNGAPEANIPARPFMVPGIERAREKLHTTMHRQAQHALAGDRAKVMEGFERVGFAAVDGITSTIRDGIAPALSERTLEQRAARGRKGAQAELDRRAKGLKPGMYQATPLMDTGELLKSITYVVRKRSDRKE